MDECPRHTDLERRVGYVEQKQQDLYEKFIENDKKNAVELS